MDDLNKQYKAIVRSMKLKSLEEIDKLKEKNRQLEYIIEAKEKRIDKMQAIFSQKMNSLEADF